MVYTKSIGRGGGAGNFIVYDFWTPIPINFEHGSHM